MGIAIAAVVAVVLAAISGTICFRLGISHRKRVAEAQIGSAEAEAKRLVDEAVKTAENKKRESLLKPIQEEIYNAVQEIADEKKYDIVKDRSADPSLIYMSSRLDISDQVL